MIKLVEYNAGSSNDFEVMTEKTAERNSAQPMEKVYSAERDALIMAGRSPLELSGGFDFDEYRDAAKSLNSKLSGLPSVDRHTALTVALEK